MTHNCHWPSCNIAVPPKMWGCKKHWFTLPLKLRQKVWATYIPGQEITKTPSREYLLVANEVQRWIAEYEQNKTSSQNTKGKQTGSLSEEQIQKLRNLV